MYDGVDILPDLVGMPEGVSRKYSEQLVLHAFEHMESLDGEGVDLESLVLMLGEIHDHCKVHWRLPSKLRDVVDHANTMAQLRWAYKARGAGLPMGSRPRLAERVSSNPPRVKRRPLRAHQPERRFRRKHPRSSSSPQHELSLPPRPEVTAYVSECLSAVARSATPCRRAHRPRLEPSPPPKERQAPFLPRRELGQLPVKQLDFDAVEMAAASPPAEKSTHCSTERPALRMLDVNSCAAHAAPANSVSSSQHSVGSPSGQCELVLLPAGSSVAAARTLRASINDDVRESALRLADVAQGQLEADALEMRSWVDPFGPELICPPCPPALRTLLVKARYAPPVSNGERSDADASTRDAGEPNAPPGRRLVIRAVNAATISALLALATPAAATSSVATAVLPSSAITPRITLSSAGSIDYIANCGIVRDDTSIFSAGSPVCSVLRAKRTAPRVRPRDGLTAAKSQVILRSIQSIAPRPRRPTSLNNLRVHSFLNGRTVLVGQPVAGDRYWVQLRTTGTWVRARGCNLSVNGSIACDVDCCWGCNECDEDHAVSGPRPRPSPPSMPPSPPLSPPPPSPPPSPPELSDASNYSSDDDDEPPGLQPPQRGSVASNYDSEDELDEPQATPPTQPVFEGERFAASFDDDEPMEAPAEPAPVGQGSVVPGPPVPPLTTSNARGRRVLVPRSLWPGYACTEHGGQGWEATVKRVERAWCAADGWCQVATVDFAFAMDEQGRRYACGEVPLFRLLPLRDDAWTRDWAAYRRQRAQADPTYTRRARAAPGEQLQDTARRRQARVDAAVRVHENARRRKLAKSADDLLLELHSCSCSLISANSRRLRFFEQGSDEHMRTVDDVKADLTRYAHVDLETKVQCICDYVKQSRVEMKVCGACGVRDPEESYTRSGALCELQPDHWLRPDADALARLNAMPPFELVKRNESGVLESVTVHRRDLHNLVEVNGQCFHCVPEALLEGGCIDLCKCCSSKWSGASAAAQRRDYHSEREAFGPFVDLYSKNAPVNSIAAGFDYGRMSKLHELGIETDVSVIERLVLGDARCHSVTYQVVAYGEQTRRQRLDGHTIIFPQAPVYNPGAAGMGFGVAVLKAALANVRILFVGPKGNKTILEQSALRMCKRDGDLRLRLEVLFNFLTLKDQLHTRPGTFIAPTLAELDAMLAEHNVEAHILAKGPNIRYEEDDSLARLADASDVAGARAVAQSATQRAAAVGAASDAPPITPPTRSAPSPSQPTVNRGQTWWANGCIHGCGCVCGDDGATNDTAAELPTLCCEPCNPTDEHRTDEHVDGCETEGGDQLLHPRMRHIGVHDRAAQQMSGVIAGIERCLVGNQGFAPADDDADADGDGGDDLGLPPLAPVPMDVDGSNNAPPAAGTGAAAGGATFTQQRTSTPCDDYESAAEAIYMAWAPLFPLRTGLRCNRAIPVKKWRHLFCCESAATASLPTPVCVHNLTLVRATSLAR